MPTPTLLPTLDALSASFDPGSLARGRRYQREGRVASMEYNATKGLITGRVRGSGGRVYACIVRLLPDPELGSQVVAQCACPVGYNCKHAVALVLATLAQKGPGSDGPPPVALPTEVQLWLDRCADGLGDDDPHRLIYVLRPEQRYGSQRLYVSANKVRRLQAGGWGKPQPFNIAGQSRAAFVTPEDQRIIALVQAGRGGGHGSGLALTDETGADALGALAASGRGHWLDTEGPVLNLGPRLDARLDWRLGEDTRLHVVLDCERPGLRLLPLVPPWYLDPETGDCGPLETGLTPWEAGLLAAAPAVAPDTAEVLERAAAIRLPKLRLPLPPRPALRRLPPVQPVPRLRLLSEELTKPPVYGYWGAHSEPETVHYALLDFFYGDASVDPRDPAPEVKTAVEGELMVRPRDSEAEHAALAVLAELGLAPGISVEGRTGLCLEPAGEADDGYWLSLARFGVPRLRAEGWRIEIDPEFDFRIAETGDWSLEIAEGEGGAWLDLALGIEVEGRRIDLLPLLLEVIRRSGLDLSPQALDGVDASAELPVRLEDGRLILMPAARLRPILGTLIELYDPEQRLVEGRNLRLPRLAAGELTTIAEADPSLHWRGGESALAWGRRLKGFQGIAPVAPPAGLNAELRPYQRQGLDWLQFLRELDLGGVLADDMGLGKTVQTLAHLLVEKASGRADRPSMVVAPTTLMFNWRREAARFAPDLKVLLLHGPQRRRQFAAIPDHDLILTTYPLLPRDLESLSAQPFHLLVLDEAQAIKNPRAKAAQAARAIQARHRLCLTGTPLENHLGELWALFDFLMPAMLGDERRFRRLFRTPIERDGDGERQDSLRRRIAPFLMRRTKEAVASELPPKTEILREVPLASDQRDLYETLRLALHRRVQAEVAKKGLGQSGIIILDALLKLRQVCCDPRLVSVPSAARVKGSAKLELLMTLLPELLEEGRRVLLFSQFTSMLALIEQALGERGIKPGTGYVKLTGQTKRRDEPVDRFQSGEVPLFLISLKAGGSGLNLTAADTVIHYDPWWNPAAERQATDRAHRIGQDKPVFVYKLLTEGTVEQRVADLQARKQALADAMLAGGGAAGGVLSPADLELLFAPIDD
jgi:superfamily II DNA or RNA helicase